MSEIELRDWFAANATKRDVAIFIPATLGDCYKLCGMLDISTVYDTQWRAELNAWARYRHADAMLAERGKRRG